MPVYIAFRRADPSQLWGFRIQGGVDFGQPLVIAEVRPDGLAAVHGLRVGDRVLSIGGDPAGGFTHQQVQQAIIRCGNELSFEVVRGPPPLVVTRADLDRSRPAAASPVSSKHQPSSNYVSPSMRHALQNGAFHTAGTSPVEAASRPTDCKSAPRAAKRGEPRSGRVGQGGACANTSKPTCYDCKADIRGPFLVALEFCFCPGHFRCLACKSDLTQLEFVEQDGDFHCSRCFARDVAERCAACSQPIIGTVVTAVEKKWHSACFVCAHCKKEIGEEIFRLGDDAQFYCDEHWKQLYQIRCEKCHQPIEEIDRFLEAFGKTFHAQCFQCAACQCPLEGKPFHSRDGKAFCRAHAHAVALFA